MCWRHTRHFCSLPKLYAWGSDKYMRYRMNEWMNEWILQVWVLIHWSPWKPACPPVPFLLFTAGSFFSCYLILIFLSSGQSLRRFIWFQAWILREKQLKDKTKVKFLEPTCGLPNQRAEEKEPPAILTALSPVMIQCRAHCLAQEQCQPWSLYPAFQPSKHVTQLMKLKHRQRN